MHLKKIFIITIFASICALAVPQTSILAYVMSSTNYRMQEDSVNFGGGMGASGNYKVEDTLGEISSGNSTSTSYNLYAGYQQMDPEIYLSINVSSTVALAPSIGGMSGGTATGSSAVGIITNNNDGYTLNIKASTSPAMQSGSSSFADYTPATSSAPDFAWGIDTADSEFGFSPRGVDIVQRYKDNGTDTCNQSGGGQTADACWDAFSTTDLNISYATLANEPSGATTTVYFKAQSGVNHIQQSGNYQATIILTGVPN
ncbi:MAG: hypothetical protein WC244_03770 [Patescibacteria group bacterium]|jgi:hypothetical protein